MSVKIWKIESLGRFNVQRDATTITRFRTQKTGALLALLACNPHPVHRRDELMEMLWPGEEVESARNRLRLALSALRKVLGEEEASPAPLVIADRVHVQLDTAGYRTDKIDFEAYLDQARRASEEDTQTLLLTKAVDLYQGDLLPGYDELWIMGERQRLADLYVKSLRELMKLLVKAQRYEAALEYARRAVTADPLREESHRNLMQLYTALGRPAAALQQYRQLENLFRHELNRQPAASTREMVAQLISPTASEQIASPAAPVVPPARPAKPKSLPAIAFQELPVPPCRFFGREAEIASLCEQLSRPETRLVSVTGLGGCGKTQLAARVARTLRAEFGRGVCFVPLAALTSASQIMGAISQSLALVSKSASPMKAIVKALDGQNLLLVMDSFEHLTGEGAEVLQELMRQLPLLTCLVTSRKSLKTVGEIEYPLSPLPVPTGMETLEQCASFACIALFVDRARAVRPSFALNLANTEHIKLLCRQLEGIPLALELAAVWAQTLTPAQMLARLSPRLPLLVSRSNDTPTRHSSLRTALNWSYQAIPPPVQRFMRLLSVFRGGWTLEAAETVCREPETLEYLTQLREHSLLIQEDDGEVLRFSYLDIVQEYGAELLAQEEKNECAGAHGDYFLQLAQAASPHLMGADAPRWIEQIEKEQGNFRAVLGSAVLGRELRMQVAVALWRFWYVTSRLQEGQEWLSNLLDEPEAVPNALLLKGYVIAGNIEYLLCKYDRAKQLFDIALALARSEGSLRAQATILGNLGNIATDVGDYTDAEAFLKQSLAQFQQLNAPRGTALNYNNLADLALITENYSDACALYAKCLPLLREVDDKAHQIFALNNLALALLQERKETEAWRCVQEGMELASYLQFAWGVASTMERLARLAERMGRVEEAALLLGASEAERSRNTTPSAPFEKKEWDALAAALQERMGEARYRRLLEQGNALDRDQGLAIGQNILNAQTIPP